MIFNASGGGAALNFKVVGGTTSPASPTENTIWVNTGESITSWAFAVAEPDSPTEGMVWVAVGASSTVAFNALRKNALMIYPISAKQYVGGVWVDKTAMSYQGGQWVDWIMDIIAYDGGIQDLELVYTKASDKGTYIQLTLGANSSVATVKTEPVNLTGLNTLEVVYSNRTGTGNLDTYFNARVWSEDGKTVVKSSTSATTATSGTLTVDISDLEGMYCIGFTAANYASGSGYVRCKSIKALTAAS